MSSNPPNKPLLRVTGDGSIFLNRVKQAAAQKVADAANQRSATIGQANTDAASVLADAHATAAEVFSPKQQGIYVVTDQGLFRSDLQGNCEQSLSLNGAADFVIDIAAQRIYWSELRSAANQGSSDCPQQDQIALYPQPSFQGTPWRVSAPMTADGDYTNLQPLTLDKLPPGFQVGSVKIGPNTVLTVFEKSDSTGRVEQFTEDSPSVTAAWPINSTASCATSHTFHCLMSARLDGSQKAQLAGLPELNPRNKYSALALDSGRGLLFWFTPTGQIMNVDLSGVEPVVLQRLGGIPSGFLALAVDNVNQNLYWSMPEIYGVMLYAPSTQPWDHFPRTLVVDASRHFPPFPFNLPNDWFTVGKPPVRIAPDPANNRMYLSNGQQLWRAQLDGSFLPGDRMQPTPNQVWTQRLYGSFNSAWGLTLDQPNQMLYWIAENDLMQMHVDPTLDDATVLQSAKKVFTFQGLKGHSFSILFFGSADISAANKLVTEAHADRAQKQKEADQDIDSAHKSAADTRQAAQAKLDQAHTQAAGDILQAQQLAAGRRDDAINAAQQRRDQANQNVEDANGRADADRASANAAAQALIDKKQTEANDIRQSAQTQLDQARQRLQNT